MRRPVLRHVADHVGVSEATVSRVLNQRPGVSPANRQRVLEALEALGYDRAPRNAAPPSTLVGLIIPELTNPAFPALAQAIETRVARHGLFTVLCTSTPEGMPEQGYVTELLQRKVAGIIFVSGLHADTTADHGHYRDLRARGVPTVLVNGQLPGIDVPAIATDDVLASELAVRHLAQLGHRRIGLAAGEIRLVPMGRKLRGFRDAVAASPGVTGLVEEANFTFEGGRVAAARLLEQRATAIVAPSDMIALGAVRAAVDRGLAVPGDVSVVGFDDTVLTGFTDPPLTSVRQPVPAIATAAVQALVDQLHRHPQTFAGELLLEPELVVRRSTAPAPG